MDILRKLFLSLEYRWHRVDEYLARQRGEFVFAADCASRAEECQRELDRIHINRRYRHG